MKFQIEIPIEIPIDLQIKLQIKLQLKIHIKTQIGMQIKIKIKPWGLIWRPMSWTRHACRLRGVGSLGILKNLALKRCF